MSASCLTQQALRRTTSIHTLSRRVNTGRKRSHAKKLLYLMREHVAEIEGLWKQGDPHAVVEAGDLLVLCLELILESGACPNAVIEECFGRYEKKLRQLLNRRRKHLSR